VAASVRFDFLSSGAARLAADFRNTGDSASAAARGAKVLETVIGSLGQKENRTAAESAALARALRLTGDAEDRAAAKALAADIAVRRLDDAMKDSSKNTGRAGSGFAGLVGAVTGFGDASTAASSKSTLFAKALAGINLATGVLEPALAGLVVVAGGLVAGFAAAGAGLSAFSLVAKANFSAASTAAGQVETAQNQYTASIAKAEFAYKQQMAAATTAGQRKAAEATLATAKQAAEARQVKATTLAYAELTPAQVAMSKQIGDMKNQWQKFTQSFAPMLNQIVGTFRPLFGTILGDIGKLATAGGTAIQALLPSLGVALNSPGFQKFITTLADNAGPAIVKIGAAIGHVVVGIGGILKAFMPVSQGLLTGVDRLTAKFATWGQTLTGHSGFASLMSTFKTETPLAIEVLKNLGTVLLNVGKAMTGLAGVGNSKTLLQALIPLSGILASLSKNTALDRIVLYLVAAGAAANKLGPAFTGVKAAVAFFPAAAAAIAAFAGAAEGATVAETIAAAATRAWGIAMAALPWVALAAAVVAVAVLIIKYHTQIWNFMKRVWNDILGFISGVWHWVQQNWPLLLGIITGPVGLAILWVVQHFGTITTAVNTVLTAVKTAWNTAWGALKTAFGLFIVNGILTPLGYIITGAAKAFGWIPGLGGKLKTAATAFNTFKDNVNKAFGLINGRTVNVSVAMTSSTNPYPGGISGRKAAGGRITGPGGPRSDTAGLFALSSGEWVIRADSAARYGLAAMDAVNRGDAVIGYAAGGGVNVKAGTPSYKTVETSLMASVTKLAIVFAKAAQAAQAAAQAGSGVSGAGPAGGDRGTNLKLARSMFPWPASQWPAFNTLEMHEAGYDRFARNRSSGAYGIPQALPPTKMPFAAQAAGGSHAGPQLSWMFAYIRGRYGTPANAWAQYYAHPGGVGWYGGGLDTMFSRPTLIGVGERGPEHVTVTPGTGGNLAAKLDQLVAEVRQLNRTAAAIPAATGAHVGGAISGAAGAAGFRNRYTRGGA